jgi:hypothetical protein
MAMASRAIIHIMANRGGDRDFDRIPPRHRDPVDYYRASRFWDDGDHYFGYRVSYLPPRYSRYNYWGVDYYYYNDVYYRYLDGYYYVSRPPYGVYFNSLADDIVLSLCNFAYYTSIYNTYNTINENALTITRQNATIAQNNAMIAAQNQAIALNSSRANRSYNLANSLGLVQSYADASTGYYYEDGMFFIRNAAGKYVTIVPPAGALVQKLPDDYQVVSINGQEYYAVDDTIYRASVIDGSLYFEVLGQMTGDVAVRYLGKE